VLHGERGIDGFLQAEESASVGEAVGRNIQRAHDECALTEKERTGGKFETKVFSCGHAWIKV
jgi:hypothetical protein